MRYNLRGKIARAHPYSLDKTLTVEGAAAEAKATGELIEEAKKQAREHAEKQNNPHGVTKEQVGLGFVDNTPDMEKPVSAAQAEAIENARNVGMNAQTRADEAYTLADNVQNAVEQTNIEVSIVKTTATSAYSLANQANTLANKKVSQTPKTVDLKYYDWVAETLTVAVAGVKANNTVVISPVAESHIDWIDSMVRCTGQAEGALTFKCNSVPEVDITVNVLILD